MKRFHVFLYSLRPYVLASISGALTLAQIVLAVLLYQPQSEILQWAGWICLWIAGLFGVLPIISLRRMGGVPRGKSYVHTTTLVDSGIYAVVRHPQGGVAGLLINLGLMLVVPHWLVIAPGLVALVLTYLDTFKADRDCVEKFGDDYKRYMLRVPRVNFVAGLIRLLQPGKREEDQ